MNRYLLIDGNNLTHAAQSAKKLTVGDTEVQAIFVFIKMMRTVIGKYPMCKPVVLWDGASWRYMDFPEYKGNRDKEHTPAYKKQTEERASAKKQIPAIKKAMTLLGVDQVRASNMEGDDLAAIMGDLYVKRGDKVVLCSGDKDWIQLAGPSMLWFDPIKDRKVRTPEDIETAINVKVKSFRQFVEFKALCGDSGDNIGGVGGIGDKGAQEFLETFGSFTNFTNGCMDGTIDPKKLAKKFRDLAEDEDKQMLFSRNIWLMDLRTPKRPAPLNLTVTRGEPDLERFETFCRRLMFQSFLTDLPTWASAFPAFRMEEAA
ncbi:PIN domain nuclease [Mesorhizobium sp.]|uniref:PIN domain nuclease n=1 Tax=Mesorhizobium sp. TaxID=1871066 RepID=UPI000FE34BE2|nr:PIN domain nuclease [Mesorhizobium sp.]RWJ03402.1 MAG: hypothetical protein EOR24_31985 [Mesorhizobium sp.]